MGYYTGTIFEIEMAGLGCSVAGGGRYDKMIGNFGANPTPACGFSIGFERIITILKDQGFTPPEAPGGIAVLVDKKAEPAAVSAAFAKAGQQRAQGVRVTVLKRGKNAKRQKEQLTALGYNEIQEVF